MQNRVNSWKPKGSKNELFPLPTRRGRYLKKNLIIPKMALENVTLTKKRPPSYLKGLTGALHPAFKHGQGNVRATTPLEIKQLACWKKAVLANMNFKCFLSNEKTSKKDPLICHHLEGWDKNKALRFDPKNGICLKRSIHKLQRSSLRVWK